MLDSLSLMSAKTANNPEISALFEVGAHYGFSKSRRHPSVKPFIYGAKNKVELIDLEKTATQLETALEFIKSVAGSGKSILFVSSKSEAKEAIKKAAAKADQPFVASRWVGGTFTNFDNIRKRVEKMLDLSHKQEKGELTKYTKRERLMISREVERLNFLFGGISAMNTLPGAIVVVDPRKEHIAVEEARDKKIPIVALAGTDSDLTVLTHPIVANDTSISSIEYIVNKIAEVFIAHKVAAPARVENTERRFNSDRGDFRPRRPEHRDRAPRA
jgi:small subunit ribosomal protein S2